MKIAIIGTGIAGLGISYILSQHYDITVYEKNDHEGGHSRTILVKDGNDEVPVDTGFIVYNEKNYYHLTRLFAHLKVPVEESAMSFGASIFGGWLEYASTGLFSQRSNLWSPKFWGMIFDILRFNKTALAYVGNNEDMSLRDCLKGMRMGDWFCEYYLLAMGAAIWSCSTATILDFPARTFLQFFDNHGLLTVNGHPQWKTVKGGSREYVHILKSSFQNKIKTNCGAVSVLRDENGVMVLDQKGNSEFYDKVVFACHADEALALIQNPSPPETKILGAFSYQKNTVVVHSDISFMPRRKGCWSSWVYLSETRKDKKKVVSLSYWMNNLQNLETRQPIIVTLNPGRNPNADLIHDQHSFSHPVFDLAAIRAQKEIPALQGQNHSYFCGAYQRYGFHEDGLLSAVNVANAMGVEIPWL